MSFNFGQFRRSQVENYLTPIKTYENTVIETVSPMSASMIFADKVIQLPVQFRIMYRIVSFINK